MVHDTILQGLWGLHDKIKSNCTCGCRCKRTRGAGLLVSSIPVTLVSARQKERTVCDIHWLTCYNWLRYNVTTNLKSRKLEENRNVCAGANDLQRKPTCRPAWGGPNKQYVFVWNARGTHCTSSLHFCNEKSFVQYVGEFDILQSSCL